MNIWSIVTGGITDLVGQWFTVKKEKAQAKHETELEVLSQKRQKSQTIADYDLQAQKNMATTLKDEYLMILHTFLIWGYIIPSETLTVKLDLLWDKLATAPTWWQAVYIGMVVSTYGLRFMWENKKFPIGTK